MATAKKAKPAPRKATAASTAKPAAKSTARRAAASPATKPSPSKAPAEPASAARRAYDALIDEIHDAERDELRGWDRKWEAVAKVLDQRLYLFDPDAPTAPAWMKKHMNEAYRTGFRNARVAALASPDEEQRYTVTKIDLAYSIDEARRRADATKKGIEWSAPDKPHKLALDALRYTIERDGKRVKLGLAEVSVAELRALQSREAKAEGAPAARISKSARALVRAIAAEKSLRNVSVRERDNALSIDHVRADQLPALGRVLLALDAASNDE